MVYEERERGRFSMHCVGGRGKMDGAAHVSRVVLDIFSHIEQDYLDNLRVDHLDPVSLVSICCAGSAWYRSNLGNMWQITDHSDHLVA